MDFHHLRRWIEHLCDRQELKNDGKLAGPVFAFKTDNPKNLRRRKKGTAKKRKKNQDIEATSDDEDGTDEENMEIDMEVALALGNETSDLDETSELGKARSDEDEAMKSGDADERDNTPGLSGSDRDKGETGEQELEDEPEEEPTEKVASGECEVDSPAANSKGWQSRIQFLRSLSTFGPYLDLVKRLAVRKVCEISHLLATSIID